MLEACGICSEMQETANLLECGACQQKICMNYETDKSCVAVIGWFSNVLCTACVSKFCAACRLMEHSTTCSECKINKVCDSCIICGQCSSNLKKEAIK